MQRSGNMFYCNLDEVAIEEGFNVRYDYGDIKGLAQSIIENGIKVPLKGKIQDDVVVITDGHRRLKAVEYAYQQGYTDIKIPVVREGRTSEEDRVLGLILYNEGKPLTMLEEAEVYKRLEDWGWKAADIARKVGKSKTHIGNCLTLLTASPDLKKKIKAGGIAASTVVEMLKGATSTEVVDKIEAIEKTGEKVTRKHTDKQRAEKKEHEAIGMLKGIYEVLMNSDEQTDWDEVCNDWCATIKEYFDSKKITVN